MSIKIGPSRRGSFAGTKSAPDKTSRCLAADRHVVLVSFLLSPQVRLVGAVADLSRAQSA